MIGGVTAHTRWTFLAFDHREPTRPMYLRQWARYILIPGCILAFWAAWYNVWGVELYEPRLLRFLP